MQVFNTLGREMQEFTPIKPGKVSFYHCGPTVYWRQHIGNMRAMVMADLVRRTFLYNKFNVTYVRNYTDVGHLTSDGDTGEDKMEKAAKRDSLSPTEIADRYIRQFEEDVKNLGIIEPNDKPKATEHINEMIDLVNTLLEKGFAYQTELAIYFDVSKRDEYTKLSGQKLDDLLSGTGHGEVMDSNKRNPHDFSLWFFKAGPHANALQTWKNQFSDIEGFPGWHIECSAFIKKYLGETIDIHMGGVEHVPIHHTNEIAQSESAHDSPLSNFWIHNEHLLVDNHKMSKSEGTSFTISDIEEKGYSAMDLRYFFAQAHYRSKQNFTWDSLDASRTARKRLSTKISRLPGNGNILEEWTEKFRDVISNDFNIPEGLAIAHELLKSDENPADIKATILDFDSVLGLNLHTETATKVDIPDHVLKLLEQRKIAREDKDWDLSDTLRGEIRKAGYLVSDFGDEQKIKKVDI